MPKEQPSHLNVSIKLTGSLFSKLAATSVLPPLHLHIEVSSIIVPRTKSFNVNKFVIASPIVLLK